MKKSKKPKRVRNYLFLYILYLAAIWTIYRVFFYLPEVMDELFIKPLFWVVPLFIVLWKEGRKLDALGITSKNLFPSFYLALLLGAVFFLEALGINFIKYSGFSFEASIGNGNILTALLISFVTAATEEITFRGYIFGRLLEKTKNEWFANFVSSFLWVSIHLPVAYFVWRLSPDALTLYLFLVGLFGVGAAFIYARTENIFSSILLHVLWAWPVILFR